MDQFDNIADACKGRIGEVLNGKWHLDDLLGVGGMAAVYAATHRNGAKGAIKILHAEMSAQPELRERFLREAYIANQVDHKGAVRVFDDDVDQSSRLFIVMELLHGDSLENRAKKAGGVLPATEVLAIADGVLDVLTAAHAVGIVHRDIKPDNVFVTDDGVVKVLDFGIARMRAPGEQKLTQTGHVFGTPAFMPPEQALGRQSQVDARTDLWAVGAIVFSLVSGQYVHQGNTMNEIVIAAATQPPRSLARAAPKAPIKLVRFVDKSLQFEPSRRFASAQEMRVGLKEVLGSTPKVAPAAKAVPNPASQARSQPSEAEAAATMAAPYGKPGAAPNGPASRGEIPRTMQQAPQRARGSRLRRSRVEHDEPAAGIQAPTDSRPSPASRSAAPEPRPARAAPPAEGHEPAEDGSQSAKTAALGGRMPADEGPPMVGSVAPRRQGSPGRRRPLAIREEVVLRRGRRDPRREQTATGDAIKRDSRRARAARAESHEPPAESTRPGDGGGWDSWFATDGPPEDHDAPASPKAKEQSAPRTARGAVPQKPRADEPSGLPVRPAEPVSQQPRRRRAKAEEPSGLPVRPAEAEARQPRRRRAKAEEPSGLPVRPAEPVSQQPRQANPREEDNLPVHPARGEPTTPAGSARDELDGLPARTAAAPPPAEPTDTVSEDAKPAGEEHAQLGEDGAQRGEDNRHPDEADMSSPFLADWAPVGEEELTAMRELFQLLDRALSTGRQYGSDHPEVTRRFRTLEEHLFSSLARCEEGLVWHITPYGFGAGETLVWEPEPPFDRIPYELFADGIRTIGVFPGLDAGDFNRFLAILTLDRARDMPPEDDFVTLLWEASFEHIDFDAIDSFAEGDQKQRAAHERARQQVVGAAHFDTSYMLEECWADSRSVPGAAKTLVEGKQKILGALGSGEHSDVESAVQALSFGEALDDAKAQEAAAKLTTTDEAILDMLAARLGVEPQILADRFARVAAQAFVDFSRDGTQDAIGQALRRAVDGLADTDPLAAVDMVRTLTEAVFIPEDANETSALRSALAGLLVSPALLRGVWKRVSDEDIGEEMKEAYLEGLRLILEHIDATNLLVIIKAFSEIERGQVFDLVVEYIRRVAPGREALLLEQLTQVPLAHALAFIEILAGLGTPAAREAIVAGTMHPEPLVRVAALGHIEGLSSERLRTELRGLLQDRDPEVRMAALVAMEEHNVRVAGPFLALRVRTQSFYQLGLDEKRQALSTLATLTEGRTEAICLEILADTKLIASTELEETRELAAHTLGQVGSTKKARDALEDLSKRRWKNSERVRFASRMALQEMESRLSDGAPEDPGGER